MSTLLLMYLGGSFLLAVIALPLIFRKVKPNPFYGFRVRRTLEDPQVWYETNQYFAKRLFAVGILQAVASLGLYFIPNISVDTYALSCLGVFVVLFFIALIQSWKYMKSMMK